MMKVGWSAARNTWSFLFWEQLALSFVDIVMFPALDMAWASRPDCSPFSLSISKRAKGSESTELKESFE